MVWYIVSVYHVNTQYHIESALPGIAHLYPKVSVLTLEAFHCMYVQYSRYGKKGKKKLNHTALRNVIAIASY